MSFKSIGLPRQYELPQSLIVLAGYYIALR